MLGACWMLLWLGLSAKWQQRSFWTPENLIASIFYGGRSIQNGFSWSTVSGLAMYLSLYSVLGALFALAAHGRVSRRRTMLAAVVFALCWYYLSFRLLWKLLMPLVALLHIENSTILGHLLYGVVLGRFPVYLESPPTPEQLESPATPEAAPAGDSADGEPSPQEGAPLLQPPPEHHPATDPEIVPGDTSEPH
jgi:hypothetical protein